MLPDRPHEPPPAFRDRRTRLRVLGVLLVVLGACCLLLAGFTALGALATARFAPGAHLRPVQVLQGLLFYLVAGAAVIALGVGSFLCRRWARPLVLVLAWAWLLLGVSTSVMLFGLLPRILGSMPAAEPAATHFVVGCMGAVSALLGILAPLVLLLLYRGPDVRATFAAHDPTPRWTDRVPTPLLGFSLWMAATALGMLSALGYAVFPVGPVLLTGAPAVALELALAALWGYLAIGLARRSRAAWWTALAATLATGGWLLYAVPRTDFQAFGKAMGLVQQPGMPDVTAMYGSPWFLEVMAVVWAAMLGYLLFVRRYVR